MTTPPTSQPGQRPAVPTGARTALLKLHNEEFARKRMTGLKFSLYYIFPGAVGRGGSWLAKHGYANNLGRVVYSGNSRGELPDAYVKFELTPKGRKMAKQLLAEDSAAADGKK